MKSSEKTVSVHVPGDAYWIGTNIHRLRMRHKLTRETLAQAAGIQARSLKQIEDAAEASNPTLKTLGAIARALGVETVALFKRHPEEDFKV